MSKIETTTISFNVSKSINIGNFEAVKINYGQSITVDLYCFKVAYIYRLTYIE